MSRPRQLSWAMCLPSRSLMRSRSTPAGQRRGERNFLLPSPWWSIRCSASGFSPLRPPADHPEELMAAIVSDEQIADYGRDGAVYLPGLFADWVDMIGAGIERNMRESGPYAAENLKPGEQGRFFDDYCNWQ